MNAVWMTHMQKKSSTLTLARASDLGFYNKCISNTIGVVRYVVVEVFGSTIFCFIKNFRFLSWKAGVAEK